MIAAALRLYLLVAILALASLGLEHLIVLVTGLPRLLVLAAVWLVMLVTFRRVPRARHVVARTWRAAERTSLVERALLWAAVMFLFVVTLELVFDHRVHWVDDLLVAAVVAAITLVLGAVASSARLAPRRR